MQNLTPICECIILSPPLAGKVFVNTKTEFHTIEASNNESNVNSFVTVCCYEELVAGEVLIFLESSPEDQLLLRVYRCKKIYRCIDANEDLPAAFIEARPTENVRQYSMSQSNEKRVKIQVEHHRELIECRTNLLAFFVACFLFYIHDFTGSHLCDGQPQRTVFYDDE